MLRLASGDKRDFFNRFPSIELVWRSIEMVLRLMRFLRGISNDSAPTDPILLIDRSSSKLDKLVN